MPSISLARLFLPGLMMLAGSVSATTFTVTSTADSDFGSLRDAMTTAYATPGAPHTIDFYLPAGSVISLSAPLPAGTNTTLLIDGAGAEGLAIDGQGLHRLFSPGNNSPLTLHNLVLRNGFSDTGGGCIASEYGNSPVSLRNVRMQGCRTAHASAPVCGGAILSYSHVFINDAHFSASTAESGSGFASGGAICARNLVWIENSRFDGNHAIGHGTAVASGGALSGGTPLTVLRSRFIGNHARQDDPAVDTWGGAIFARNDAKATLRQSLFLDNSARNGSAVYAAVASAGAQMQLIASNNTFVANHGSAALALWDVQIDVRNNSFWRNAGRAGVGAHLSLLGNGMAVESFANNLLAASDDQGPLCSSASLPPLLGTGHNLFADASCGFIDHDSLIEDGDLRIRGLRRLDADATSMPVLDVFAGSPVIDAGNTDAPGTDNPFACTAGDARDGNRPVDGDADGSALCDIGAYEIQHEASLFADDFEQPLLR